eukprot:Gregarina_sp_Poly_1__9660@NODE_611_length_7145_cov_95_802063_g467_i0_p3_GENE_NODE_611_length_7145_cov_95_802063_g467_i0NODE_611_length_7145_cov_95_802063_g467_i0_p3_ORF_typecomplete_len310_score32_92Brr6_like_C_C/PF10104_9/0_00028Otopetrin/PF03189_13/0_11PepSY_TM/PF03929_16/0_11_NODE_611_length_7145_cov_95_802063_g467_i062067135
MYHPELAGPPYCGPFPRTVQALKATAHNDMAMNDGESEDQITMDGVPKSYPSAQMSPPFRGASPSRLASRQYDAPLSTCASTPPEHSRSLYNYMSPSSFSATDGDNELYEYYRTRIVEEDIPDPAHGTRRRRVIETIGKRPVEITSSSSSSHLWPRVWNFFYPSIIAYIMIAAVIVSMLFIHDVKAEREMAARSRAQEYQLKWSLNACDAHPRGLEEQCQLLDELRNVDAHLRGGWYFAIFTVVAKASSAPLSYFGREFASAVSELSAPQMICMVCVIVGILKGLSWMLRATCQQEGNRSKNDFAQKSG